MNILNYANNQIVEVFRLPVWLSAVHRWSVCRSVSLFGKLLERREIRFINVVTHKFRTPLTHIEWSADSLWR